MGHNPFLLDESLLASYGGSCVIIYVMLMTMVNKATSCGFLLHPSKQNSCANVWCMLVPILTYIHNYNQELIVTRSDNIESKEICLKCFTGLETWYKGSNQCELLDIASTSLKSRAKLSVVWQIESKEGKCFRDSFERLTS